MVCFVINDNFLPWLRGGEEKDRSEMQEGWKEKKKEKEKSIHKKGWYPLGPTNIIDTRVRFSFANMFIGHALLALFYTSH